MNFPLFIARRYFTSKKKKSFISLISNISMLGSENRISFVFQNPLQSDQQGWVIIN